MSVLGVFVFSESAPLELLGSAAILRQLIVSHVDI
jgi:hypothetical protein